MRRLQVGDECYVRQGSTMKLFKARYLGGKYFRVFGSKIVQEFSGREFFDDWCFRLVYPYPIIKQLAK